MNDHDPEIQPAADETLSERQLLLQGIGNTLNQARQAKHEQLSKAVRHLKIPLNHMQALESGNWESLPDDVYAIGFLRQYSAYLDIDLSSEIKQLKNNDYTLTRPLTFPDPPVAPSRYWAWLTGSAFVLLFIAFNIIGNNDEDQPPALANAGQTSIQSSSIANIEERSPSQPSTLADGQTAKPSILTSPSAATPSPHPMNPQSITPTTAINTTPAHQAQPKKIMHSFRFEAITAPVWLQVFSPNKAGNGKGRLLKELLLKKGQHSTIKQPTESLWITCGNALALRIRVDQKTLVTTGSLGGGKKVLRDYRFNLSDYAAAHP